MGLEQQRYNKGEWAELYVLLKLLGLGKLYAADSHLNKKPNSYLEVLAVLREEANGVFKEYATNGNTVDVIIDDVVVASIPAVKFLDNAGVLFDYLLTARGPSVPAPNETIQFAKTIYVDNPKSPSLRGTGKFGGKTDITLRLRDLRTSVVSVMGFSIKSQFGQPSTLYNAGTSSQLLFELRGMNDEDAEEFNSLTDARGNRNWSACVQLLSERDIDAVFIGCKSEALENNLMYIRESMGEVLAWLYRQRLLVDTNTKDLAALCKRMIRQNPLNYRVPEVYEKIIKDFLFATFSGMTGSRPWDGVEQINGGYIVVLPNGEVLCYHASDREQFRDYLLQNTFIEYVSCRKYRWGFVEKDEQGRFVLPLNAAIRFKRIPSKRQTAEYRG